MDRVTDSILASGCIPVLRTGAKRSADASDLFCSGFMSGTLGAAMPAPVSDSIRQAHWVTNQRHTHPMSPSLVSPYAKAKPSAQ